MKSSNRLLICAMAVVSVLAFQGANAQDPVKVAPQAFKEILNNDHTRVLEYQSKPGQKEAMHSHATGILYVLSDGKFKTTTPDGKSKEIDYKKGQAYWRDAMTHSGENIGTTELSAIIVEFKGAAKKK